MWCRWLPDLCLFSGRGKAEERQADDFSPCPGIGTARGGMEPYI